MKLYNTLSRTIETVEPISAPTIGLYACGLTVYDYTHLGHLRKYSMDDILIRVLRHEGFQVKFVQNVTDVGHLASDADTGEDKLEKGAKKYGKTVWDVAREFEEYFFKSMDLMGNARPDISCRATEHIEEQLAMVVELEKKGYAYVIDGDGVYFDTSKLDDYGKLAKLDLEHLQEGARVEVIEGKRNPTDFALWKFERPGENRAMVWPSPWAERSFPGWHIECSAMSMKYLGEQFDIHTGGIDHIPVHHTNEIAQAEALTGKKPFVKYWVHHNHLHVNGEKMSKSLGNFYTIDDIMAKGINPMALRLLFLTTHYRSEMNFTWENLAGAQKSLEKIVTELRLWQQEVTADTKPEITTEQAQGFKKQFFAFMEEDLNTPMALALVWEIVKDKKLPTREKLALLLNFDQVLGLQLENMAKTLVMSTTEVLVDELPVEVSSLVDRRSQARAARNWAESDRLRDEVFNLGYELEDLPGGALKIFKRNPARAES